MSHSPNFYAYHAPISQVFTSIWLYNNLITLPTSPNLPSIQKKHQNSSLMARVAWRFNQYRQTLHKKKPRIGLNNKRRLAVPFVPPSGFPSQPRNAVEMVWVAWWKFITHQAVSGKIPETRFSSNARDKSYIMSYKSCNYS